MSEKNEPTLAETLRAWVEAVDKTLTLGKDVPSELAIDPAHARFYLRGHDDATQEAQARIDALEAALKIAEEDAAEEHRLRREADQEIVRLEARVRELESFIAAQTAHDHYAERDEVKSLREQVRQLEAQLAERPQPAAVGVVGAMKWSKIVGEKWISLVCYTREEAERLHGPGVVAIVDPDAIVPLQSKQPVEVSPTSYYGIVQVHGVDDDIMLYAGAPEAVGGGA